MTAKVNEAPVLSDGADLPTDSAGPPHLIPKVDVMTGAGILVEVADHFVLSFGERLGRTCLDANPANVAKLFGQLGVDSMTGNSIGMPTATTVRLIGQIASGR
jgi:hypothetical protein